MNISEPIYLDGFSTTALGPEARRALLAALDTPGNASSLHGAGQRAASLVEVARGKVAALIGAAPSEILFTSGATEANNLALLGAARTLREAGSDRSKIVVSSIEHKAVLAPARALEAERFELVLAPVDCFGQADLHALAGLIDGRTALVALMAANNETGVLQPIAETAQMARAAGALFHCDAAQAAGKVALDVAAIGADYMSLSSHKMYGPMGVGALFVAASAPRPHPLVFGGGQERGLRSGTEPVPLIAAFGEAARAAQADLEPNARMGRALAQTLLNALRARQVRFERITGDHSVIPGSAAIAVRGCDADELCLKLAREVSLSTGSACSSGQLRQSYVLEAMGYSEDRSREVLRILCSPRLTLDEIEHAANKIAAKLH